MTGLNSGLDTESIISALMSAYNTKTEKYEKEQTKIGWKQEIWSELNTKVNTFYKSVGNLKYSSGYSMYKASASDSSKATVSTSGSAVVGSQKLHVLSTAQSGYLTGAKMESKTGSKVTSSTTMSDLGYDGGSAKIYVTVPTEDSDGNVVSKRKEILITQGSTVQNVVDKLKEAGVNASFDSNNGRIYVSSTSAGSDKDFKIEAASGSSDSIQMLGALGLDTAATVTGGIIQNLSGTATGTTTLADLSLLTDGAIKVNGKEIAITTTDTINDVVKKFQTAGVTASFDESTGKLSLRSQSGADISIEAAESGDAANNSKLLGLLGLKTSQRTESKKGVKIDASDAAIALNGVVYTSSNGTFNINGLSITANAVTDTLSDDEEDAIRDADGKIDWTKLNVDTLDDGNAITLSVSVDAQGLYDKVKDFLTNYNSIINEITKLYNADSASDYEPLTDDEKESMTDSEISKWETKIKDSLLRRDSSLGTLMSAMKNAMSQTYEVNGKKYALSSFGISTLSYGTAPTNEESAYHIDGDEDDENTSGNTDKLLAAINENPQNVVDFMKQLATSLYKAIDNQMTSTSLRTRYCIYNDKELQTQYDNYTTTISEWEEKVSDKEDYYYEKFANMETALGTLNSQTSALTGMLS
jgi:flagellar hook-associated protein 2